MRKSGRLPYLRPDGKTQVTYEYEDGRPIAVKSVLISTQHAKGIKHEQLSEGVALGPVTLTIVMVHTQKEFDLGLVCGPWDLASLKHHLELFQPPR